MNEVKYMADGAEITLNEELIKKYLVKGKGVPLSKDLHNFMQLCKYKGLNPYLNDVYLIVQGSDDDGGASTAIVVGKDFLLQRAQSHPAYDGLESGIVISINGALDYRSGGVSVIGEAIAGGWARVFRKDWEKPVFVSVALAEYAKPSKSRKSNWDKMPATMISKVAVAQALRIAFAAELRGMYTQEEITSGSLPVSSDTEAASADLAAELFNSAPEPAPADLIAAMEPAKPTPEEIRAVKEKLAPDPKPAQKPAAKPAPKSSPKPANAPAPGIHVQETLNPKPAPDPVQATFKLGQTKGEFKGCKFRIAMIFDGKSEQGQIGIVGVRADQPFADEVASITDPQLELVAELKPLSEEAKRQILLEGDLSNPRFSVYEKYWIMSAPQRKKGAV